MMIFKELSPAWNRFALCLLFSFAMSLAFPPLQLGFFAYWALLPLFFLIEDVSFKQALVWGYIAGFLWNSGTLYWIGWVTLPGLIGVLLVLPLYLAVFSVVAVLFRERFGRRHIYFLPFIWVAIEYLKSLGSLSFPWTSLAYTQTYYTKLIQYADVTGAYGVSFWVVLINVLIFYFIREKHRIKHVVIGIFVLILLFVLPYLYSFFVSPNPDDIKEEIKASVVQGNIDPYLKWDAAFLQRNFEIYDSLTYASGKEHPELIVWPETATACYIRAPGRRDYLNKIALLTDSLHASILSGSPDYRFLGQGNYKTYNGLLLFQPDAAPIQSYWKMHLVPFGERVPFEDSLPFFHDFLEKLNMGTGDFDPGKEARIFTMKYKNELLPLAGVICYESVYPDLVRRLIKMGGRLLTIVTNDAWFGKTSGPYQHARIAVFRAIENRVGIVRCANTGISSFIDPYGVVLGETKLGERTFLVRNVPLRNSLTFYTRYGDVFSYMVVGITGIGLLTALVLRS